MFKDTVLQRNQPFPNGLPVWRRQDIQDETCSRSSPSTCRDQISLICNFVEEDQGLVSETIANNRDISIGCIYPILTGKLKWSQLSIPGLPKTVTLITQLQSIPWTFDTICPTSLEQLLKESEQEMRLYQYNPQNKAQSKPWLLTGRSKGQGTSAGHSGIPAPVPSASESVRLCAALENVFEKADNVRGLAGK